MARIRSVKPTHWTDRELASISLGAHLFWIGTWNFSDDKGVFEFDPILLKSQIFPRRTDVTNEDVVKWCKELENKNFIIPLNYKGVDYYISRTFETHQKIDKPQPSKIPDENVRRAIAERSPNDPGLVALDRIGEERIKERRGKGRELRGKGITAKAVGAVAPPPTLLDENLKKKFEEAKKTKKGLVEFINAEKPKFIEPYFLLWNIFASKYSVPAIKQITPSRKRKFNVRIGEDGFDLVKILETAAKSEFLRTSKWFGFDWIIANDKNWLKVLEGNYDQGFSKPTNGQPKNGHTQNAAPSGAEEFKKTIQYLVDRYSDGDLDEKLILPEYYDKLVLNNSLVMGTMNKYQAETIDGQKVAAVKDFIKTIKP